MYLLYEWSYYKKVDLNDLSPSELQDLSNNLIEESKKATRVSRVASGVCCGWVCWGCDGIQHADPREIFG